MNGPLREPVPIEEDDGARLDAEDAVVGQRPERPVDRDAARPERFGQPVLRTREHDPVTPAAGDPQQPQRDAGSGVRVRGGQQVGLLVPQLAGRPARRTAAPARANPS